MRFNSLKRRWWNTRERERRNFSFSLPTIFDSVLFFFLFFCPPDAASWIKHFRVFNQHSFPTDFSRVVSSDLSLFQRYYSTPFWKNKRKTMWWLLLFIYFYCYYFRDNVMRFEAVWLARWHTKHGIEWGIHFSDWKQKKNGINFCLSHLKLKHTYLRF